MSRRFCPLLSHLTLFSCPPAHAPLLLPSDLAAYQDPPGTSPLKSSSAEVGLIKAVMAGVMLSEYRDIREETKIGAAPGRWPHGCSVSSEGQTPQPRGWNMRVCCQHTQAVGLLAPPVSVPVVPEPWVAGAQHPAEVIRALLLAGSLGAHVVI